MRPLSEGPGTYGRSFDSQRAIPRVSVGPLDDGPGEGPAACQFSVQVCGHLASRARTPETNRMRVRRRSEAQGQHVHPRTVWSFLRLPQPEMPPMRRNTAGIGIKLRPSERELINRAAEVADVTLSELVRRAAVARARRIIAEAEQPTGAR